jgi:hypothetical protein
MISKTNFPATEDWLSTLLRRTARKNNRELRVVTGGVFETINSLARGWAWGLCSFGKSDADCSTPTGFALNPGGAPMKIDNRLNQSQTQACSIGAAR